GLLITNQYLVTIGVSDYSSVRPKYVATGLWGLLLIFTVTMPLVIPALFYDSSDSPRVRTGMIALNFAVCCLFAALVDYVIFSLLNLDAGAAVAFAIFWWVIRWWIGLSIVMFGLYRA